MLSTANKAKEKVKAYYRSKFNVELLENLHKRKKGFDLQTPDETTIIEVKGSTKKNLSEVLFRMLTKDEFETVQKCKSQDKKYELHLVIGIDSGRMEHYIIPADLILTTAVPGLVYSLPIRVRKFRSLLSKGKIQKV